MVNTLLRSGDIKDFQLLGQDGKAVFLVAAQIRETLRVKLGREYADFLAIPQRNDQGNNIDWYIPFKSDSADGQYDIIPWRSASHEEREAAYKLLTQFEQKVIALGKQLASRQNLEGDQLLFSRLLYDPITESEKQNLVAIRFPSDDYVYIVNGKPIITFWGFVNPQTTQTVSPFTCLKPVAQPVLQQAVTSAPIKKGVPWWRRAWIWLLLLLFLLLALFLLRGCFFKPDINLALPDLNLSGSPDVAVNNVEKRPIINQPLTMQDNGIVTGRAVDSNGVIDTNQTVNTDQQINSVVDPLGKDDKNASTDDTNNKPDDLTDNRDNDKKSDQTKDPNQEQNSYQNPVDPNNGENNPDAATTAADNKLALPEDAMQQGSTKFLDGSWTVGGGIQDRTTGKPLRLQYDFNKGSGEVTLTRSDGVKCVGNVGSNVAQSNLNITSSAEAKCSDNSKYQLPKIQCKPGNDSSANCEGFYDNGQKFPITIKKN